MLNISPSCWLERRNQNMTAARQCRDALTNPNGFWRYEKDDPRVAKAVSAWVERARSCHAIAMGRRPVIEKAVVINQGEAVTGSLWAA